MSNQQFDLIRITENIRLIIDTILNSQPFDSNQIQRWNQSIHQQCQQFLQKQRGDSAKILISTMILPKNDSQIHLSNACLWDFQVDGSTNIK